MKGNRTCLQCKTHIYGRTDKKFCTNYCRSAYHNARSVADVDYVRRINYQLQKNRRILASILLGTHQKKHISYSDLFLRGFSFLHFTHREEGLANDAWVYCYEYGYQLIDNEQVRIVQQEVV